MIGIIYNPELPRSHKTSMDYTTPFIIISTLWLFLLTISTLTRRRRSSIRLPPGPKPYPLVGNILHLGPKPHLSLTALSKTYGSIISLKLGNTTTVVVSTPDLAQKVLQKLDQAFYMRAVPDAARPLAHNKVSMVWAQSPAQFRNLRKLCNSQLFTTVRLDSSQNLRRLKIQQLLDHVSLAAANGEAVDLGPAAFTTALNLLSTTFFSTDLASYSSDESHEFKDFVWGIMVETGKPNLADFFPALQLIDPQGVYKRAKVCFEGVLKHFDRLIEQRLKKKTGGNLEENEDVLGAMLRIVDEEGSEIDRNDMMHLLLDLFIAGTDTTSSTLEWAMAELLHNPATLQRANAELALVIGTNRPVEESDIPNLPYMQAVVKETLRLHPPAPLLLPHKAMMDMELDGYTILEDTRVLVNLWAIHRDEKLWPKADVFLPERFVDGDNELVVERMGCGFKLLPFGSGRRICPGMPLAHRMVHLMLASLLHKFEWQLENGMRPEDMDMSDKFGITLQRTVPLRAIPLKKV